MVHNQITNPNKYGFVSGSSCETLLIELLYNIRTNLDIKDVRKVRLVFFDYSDAFNKVPVHELVSKNVAETGIAGKQLELFRRQATVH